jgi:hypothetical protein
MTKLRVGRFGVPILAGTRHLSLIQNLQTIPGAHPALCSMCTGSSFPRDKETGA